MSHALYKQIKDLNDKMDIILAHFEKTAEVDDLLVEKDAAIFLGISIRTLQNNVYKGRLDGKFIKNAVGQRMYYKSKLISYF